MRARPDSSALLLAAVSAAALLLPAVAAATPAAGTSGFRLWIDPLALGLLETDVDTDSAKFEEYRDLGSGAHLPLLRIFGASADGERTLAIRARNVGRDDARYGFDYGLAGRYSISLDYNKIPHRFGNAGRLIWNRTGPGRYEIPDAVQGALQGALEEQFLANRSGINFAFLDGLVAPVIASADRVDVGLRRDRTLARVELGKRGALAWNLEYSHENRAGTRPFGASFGFNNVTELPEPIDYDTTGAAVGGEWSTKRGGLTFGYRHSRFENNVSTLVWDNPFRLADSTDSSAYSSPGSGSIGGSSLGRADLAPDNESDSLFAGGRFRLGGAWWAGGSVAYTTMEQDDALLPYTANSAIVGIDFDHSEFDPTDAANLPASSAGAEAKVLSLNGDVGTRFGRDWSLVFRYRYYDYDNESDRLRFPGYVRFHAVWEDIPRITVPYEYSREQIGAELGWDLTDATHLGLVVERLSWDRTFREVSETDETLIRLTADSRPTRRLQLRARYEIGDRSVGTYDPEAQEASFLDPSGISNHPLLRKYDQAARESDAYDLAADFTVSDDVQLHVQLAGRDDDYDQSALGLVADETLQYNFEISYAPGEGHSLHLFGHRSDRETFQRARQSGSTPSTNPLDDWSVLFDETTDTWGLGWNRKLGSRWRLDLTGRWSRSDGGADFTAQPGGAPLAPPASGLPPRQQAQDFDNYEDVELLAATLELGYEITGSVGAVFSWLYEDYTIDSFIVQGLRNYLPGAFLLAAENGDYTAHAVSIDLRFTF